MGDSGKVMLLPRGEYYSATPYEELDCVYYQGRSYVCKQASTGHAPTDTTYWQPMTPDASAEIQALTNEVEGNWSEGGKNLFDPSAYSSYKQSDGSYRLTGSQANTIRVNVPKSLVGVECTASIYLDLSQESAPTQVYICATVSGTTSYGNRIGANSEGVTKITFTPQSVSDTIGLTFGSEGSNYFTMTDLQLEKGTEVTEYVPYAKTNVELTHRKSSFVEASLLSDYADYNFKTVQVGNSVAFNDYCHITAQVATSTKFGTINRTLPHTQTVALVSANNLVPCYVYANGDIYTADKNLATGYYIVVGSLVSEQIYD